MTFFLPNIVLPPVPTTDVTTSSEDVSALATRVRDQMLAALREISVKVPSDVANKSPDPTTNPSFSAPANQGASSPDRTNEATEVPSPAPVPSFSEVSSPAASQVLKKDGSENGTEGGTETEEDEGMVLVGRPH